MRAVAGLLVLLSALLAADARAVQIELSNFHLRSWNGVVVHEPGSEYSMFYLQEQTTSDGSDVLLSNDVGFAVVDALSSQLALFPRSEVDARNIDQLGYDYAVAEGSARFEADLIIRGSGGTAHLEIDPYLEEISWTDEPGFATTGISRIRVRRNGQLVGSQQAGESASLVLEQNTLYRFEMSATAYSRATQGHQTHNDRRYSVELFAIPEPSSAVLLSLGLAGLSRLRQRKSAV